MSTMELRSLLLKEVAAIITDDELTSEALKALKSLRHKPPVKYKKVEEAAPCNNSEDTPPCNNSTEYVRNIRERVPNALMRYEQGEYASQEEMLKRIEQWK